MEYTQQTIEERQGSLIRRLVDRLLIARFDHLKVPTAELVAVQFEDRHQGFGQTVFTEQISDLRFGLCQLGIEPLNSITISCWLLAISDFQTLHHAETVPDLIAEVTSLLTQRIIVQDIVSGRRTQQNTHTDTVGTEALDQVQRIGTVTQRFGHLTTQFITYDTGEIHVLKRHFALVLITRHDHTCYPEEDDIRTRYKVCGGVVVIDLFVVRFFDTVKQTDRPQPATEPGVQCTFILHVIAFRFGFGNDDFVIRIVLQTGLRQQIGIVVRRDTVTPPELTTDTPVLDVLQPVAVGILVLSRIEDDIIVHYRRQSDIRKMFHFDKPLQTQPRLDRYIRTLGITDFIVVVFDLLHETGSLQILNDLLAAFEAVHTVVLTYVGLQLFLDGIHVQMGVSSEDIDGLEVVFLTQGVVVHVMRRCHF